MMHVNKVHHVTFTDFGIENLIELVRFYKENPELLRRWHSE